MLHFYPSNHSENLASVISQIMSRQPLSNPFDHEVILIQSQGMGTWLKQQLSEELGVAAMIEALMPASFIWKLSEHLLPEDKLIPRFEKRYLRWELMRVLPQKLNDERYRSLAHYLAAQGQHDKDEAQMHLFHLCDRLADLYDAYQNYRPDWIMAWESSESAIQGLNSQGLRDTLVEQLEAWQADLWRSVYANLDLKRRLHRPDVLGRLKNALESLHPSTLESGNIQLPKRLFIFGLSALPPQWLPLFESLSRVIDVHFLAFNPCQLYWGDIQTQNQQLQLQKRLVEQGVPKDIAAESVYESNPLLASWGKLGRDYVSLISASEQIRDISVDLYEAPDREQSALKAVQHDILNLESEVHPIADDDDSIHFAVCHSRLREVEALHDYLLDLLDRHTSLEAKDIIVMMPDVQAFAPFIEAVFSRPAYDQHDQTHYLSYGISDQLFSVDQPLIDVILDTLSLSSKRVTAIEVRDWLDIAAIRSRFDIDESDLSTLHAWIEALHVRWGLSESHRDRILNATAEQGSGVGNTWLSVLRRLLAGCLYAENTPVTDESGMVLPFAIEGRDQYTLVGKLIRFIDVIQHSLDGQGGKKALSEWLKHVSDMWRLWFDENVFPDELLSMMDHAVEGIEEQVSTAGFDDVVEFDVVAAALSSQFQNERVSQRFLAGRINFCTLMPMRSIPFKVVCLLGMNEGDYPRIENKVSFDLMSQTPGRLGDRSPRSDDRYLFLEALCSAREYLYISYCGFDVKDNSERFPSVLLSEFMDYCEAFLELKSTSLSTLEKLTSIHRLQPFHPDYYLERSSLRSYCTDWQALHIHDESEPSAMPDKPEAVSGETVLLEDLIACCNHPLKFYYQKTLNVYLGHSLNELEEAEPFALNGLDLYQLKTDLIASLANETASEQSVWDEWRLSDRLPRQPVANLYLQDAVQSLQDFKQELATVVPLDTLGFHETVSGLSISGELSVNSLGQIMVSLSKNVSGVFFGYWCQHVLWNVLRSRLPAFSEYSGDSVILTPVEHYLFKALDVNVAETYFGEITRWYQAASHQPASFLSKTAYATVFGNESDIKKAFYGSNFNGQNFGEAQDPYWQRACHLGSLEQDSDQIPVFKGQCLFDQVLSQWEQEMIEITELGGQ